MGKLQSHHFFTAAAIGVQVLGVVFLYLFLDAQKKVEGDAKETNPYDWYIQFAFWAGCASLLFYAVAGVAIAVLSKQGEKKSGKIGKDGK